MKSGTAASVSKYAQLSKQRKVAAFVTTILLSPSSPLTSAVASFQTSTFPHVTKSQSVSKPCTHRFMTASDSSDPNPLKELGLPSPLILGSGSFTRKLILKEMNIPYILKVRPIDERIIGDRRDGSDPKKLVMTLARAKGEHLIQGLLDNDNNGADSVGKEESVMEEKFNLNIDALGMKEYIVLTADQVVTCNNSILEKPDSINQAKSFVKKYGTSPPSTVGAVMLTHLPSGISVSGVDTAQINFSQMLSKDDCNEDGKVGLADDLIDRLVENGAPVMSCAGGLMVEHPFVKEFIVGIDGTEDSVMGLSKELVLKLLEELKEKLEASVEV